MPDPAITSQRALAAYSLRRQMLRIQAEIDGVRDASDIECVHRMRVASRRLRSVMRVFHAYLPNKATLWQKPIKRITRALAQARDYDVQIEALSVWRAALNDRSNERATAVDWLLDHCHRQRLAVQPELDKEMRRLSQSGVLRSLRRWTKKKSGDLAAEPPASILAVHLETLREQVNEVLAGASSARLFEAVPEHHATRLAVKRLRYTLEPLAPIAPEAFAPLIDSVRRLQVTLGNLHDCDVWIERLPADRVAAEKANAEHAVIRGMDWLIEDRRAERVSLFNTFLRTWDAELMAGTWGRILRIGSELEDGAMLTNNPATQVATAADWDPGLQRLRDRFDPDQEHTQRVARNADQLFIALADLHQLGSEARGWLQEAAWLHDIGWCEGRQRHHKTSLRLIFSSDELNWKDRHRQIVGSVARYHRKALPTTGHAHFAALAKKDRAIVQKLSAILRIADGLDYAHEAWLIGIGAAWTSTEITINCRAEKPPTYEVDRALAKADLARLVFDRDVTLTWHLQELPTSPPNLARA